MKSTIRIGNEIYRMCETGDFILCGKIYLGIDGEFIKWLN